MRRHGVLGNPWALVPTVNQNQDAVPNTTNLTITHGLSPSQGQVMLIILSGSSSTTSITPPSGWTRVGFLAASNRFFDVYSKIATSSEPSSYSFSFSPNFQGMWRMIVASNLEVNLATGMPMIHLNTIKASQGSSAALPATDNPYNITFPCLAICMASTTGAVDNTVTITNSFIPGISGHAGSAKIWYRVYSGPALNEQPTIDTKGLNFLVRMLILSGKRV